MTNEAVAFVLIIAIFVFSVWLALRIKLLSQKIARIEAIAFAIVKNLERR